MPRFTELGPVFQSLLAQGFPAQGIHLYRPQNYRRFPGWDGAFPRVPDGVTICRCPEDLGPATKIVPTLAEFKGQGGDALDNACIAHYQHTDGIWTGAALRPEPPSWWRRMARRFS